jgi:hypothetical protein
LRSKDTPQSVLERAQASSEVESDAATLIAEAEEPAPSSTAATSRSLAAVSMLLSAVVCLLAL